MLTITDDILLQWLTYMCLDELFFVDINICLRAAEIVLKSIVYEVFPSDW